MKICSKCKRELDENNFAYKNKSKGTRHSICSECSNAYVRKHYSENKSYYFDRNKERRHMFSETVAKFKSEHSCILCGESEACCLDFHHINPSEKDDNVSNVIAKKATWKSIQKEIDKCIILCSNCHRKLHAGVLKI